jgi:8-oxo-dGTP diphosphatase
MKKTHTVTIKIIFFTVHNGVLKAYLPGVHIPCASLRIGQAIEDEVGELITTMLGVKEKNYFFEQLYSVSGPMPSDEVTVVYYLLVPSGDITNVNNWFPVFDVRESFNDDQILLYAIQRLQWKIEYTNVVYSLLPLQFTLGELQDVYEAILHRTLDKRNFRKKILSLRIIRDTGKKKRRGRARPAEVYTFVKRKPTIVEIL